MNRFNKKLVALSLIVAMTSTALALTGTLAAYQNEQDANLSLNINSDFSLYFDGGNGTSDSPYLISTTTHLQNLEKLVRLGVFDTNHYFMVNNDIDCSGIVFNPIGTENNPFNSNYDGNGKVLSNVQVTSTDYDDVGFFGYVGSGGTIRNILFDTITITSTGPTSASRNPLEGRFSSSTLTDNGTGSLALSFNNATSSNPTLVVPTDRTITDTTNHTYNVYYKSNDHTLMTDTGTLLAQSADLDADTFYTTMDAIAYDTYYDSGTKQTLFMTFVVQRFQIWLDRSANGTLTFNRNRVVNNTNTAVAIPTLYNSFTTYADSYINAHDYVEDSSNTSSYVTTPTPVVYAGLIAGHLDGNLNYIGVENGSIIANTKEQVSFSTLVGKASNDTNLLENKSKTYYQDVDFNEIIDGANYQPKTYAQTSNSNRAYFNTSITDFDDTVVKGYNNNLTGIQQTDVFRLYGASALTKKDVIIPIEDEDGNLIYGDTYTPGIGGIAYSQDLNVEILTYYNYITYTRYGFNSRNGLSFWASMKSTDVQAFFNLLQAILGTNNYDFLFNIELQYSVDDCSVATTNDTYFEIQTNTMRTNIDLWAGTLHNVQSENNTVTRSSNVCASSSDSRKLLTYEYTETLTGSSAFFSSDTRYIASPVLFLGLKNSAGTGGTSTVNFHRVKFSLTSANGNTQSNLEDVDFVNNVTDMTFSGNTGAWNSGTWTSWPTYSNTYIYFWMVKFEKTVNGTPYSITDSDVNTGLRYVVTRDTDSWRGSPQITVTYYLTTNVNMIPSDTNNVATITAG